MVGDRVVHDFRGSILELAPPQMRLIGAEYRVVQGFAGDGRFAFGEDLDVVKAADEQQIGELFDHFKGVGDAAGPERIPDTVDLALQLTGDHPGNSSGRCRQTADSRQSPQGACVAGGGDRCGAGGDTELGVGVHQVGLHGGVADVEAGGDRIVGCAVGHQLEDL